MRAPPPAPLDSRKRLFLIRHLTWCDSAKEKWRLIYALADLEKRNLGLDCSRKSPSGQCPPHSRAVYWQVTSPPPPIAGAVQVSPLEQVRLVRAPVLQQGCVLPPQDWHVRFGLLGPASVVVVLTAHKYPVEHSPPQQP